LKYEKTKIDEIRGRDWPIKNTTENLHVGVNEVSVDGPSHRALDAHQAVFLGPLEDGIRLQDLRDAVVPVIGLDPADVLAPSEAPALKTESAQVEAIGRAAPEYEMKLVLKDPTLWRSERKWRFNIFPP